MTETHIFPANDCLSYELKIRQLVREGYHLNERGISSPKTFTLRNTGLNNVIYIEKSVDTPGQFLLNLAVG